jgi:hypothetical protein
LFERDIAANENKLSDIWKTRGKAQSGAQKFMLNRTGGMNLEAKQHIQLAETYAREIAENPLQARSLNFAHTVDRFLNKKDPEMSKFEVSELVTELKKGSVEFHQAKNGDFYVDGKSFNRYINKFNPNEDIKMLDDEKVKVDKNMVEDIMNASGINSKAEGFIKSAADISNIRTERQAAAMENEFAADLRGKRNTQVAAAEGEVLKTEAKQGKLQRDIKRGKLAGLSFDQIIDNATYTIEQDEFDLETETEVTRKVEVPLSSNPELIEEFENDAAKFAFRAKKNAKSFKRFSDAYKNQLGGNLKDDIENDEDTPEAKETRKRAFDWMKQQGEEFDKVINDKTVENFKKNLFRKFQRNPQKWINDRLRQKAIQQTKKRNEASAASEDEAAGIQADKTLDEVLGEGEK